MEEFDIIVENEETIDISAELENDFLRGEKGEKGDSNTLTIGTVTKGEEASASITGESPNQKLNLVLPKGDKGDKGDKGEQGIQGQNGQDGYTPVKGTDYFTEEDIQQIQSNVLDKVNQFSVQVVQELPTENIDDHTIYFVLKTNTEQNDVYDEYIYVNNDWEHIGTTAVDLSNYYNKEEVDNKVANIQALPVGGTTGQVLTKQSDTDGDASWQDSGDTLPIGSIVEYEGDTVPEGYVEVEDEYKIKISEFTGTTDNNGYIDASLSGNNIVLGCYFISDNRSGMVSPYRDYTSNTYNFKIEDWDRTALSNITATIKVAYIEI